MGEGSESMHFPRSRSKYAWFCAVAVRVWPVLTFTTWAFSSKPFYTCLFNHWLVIYGCILVSRGPLIHSTTITLHYKCVMVWIQSGESHLNCTVFQGGEYAIHWCPLAVYFMSIRCVCVVWTEEPNRNALAVLSLLVLLCSRCSRFLLRT